MRPHARHTARLLLATLALALIGSIALPGATPAASAGPVEDFVSLINQHRAANGRAPLAVHPQLVGEAQNWAQTMAGAQNIWHRPNLWAGTPSGSTAVAENVAYAGSVQQAFDALVASSGHNANMLNPGYTHIGVGVAQNGNLLYTAHIFVTLPAASPPVTAPAAAPPPPPPPPPPPTTAPPVTAPPTTIPPTTVPPTTAPPTTVAPTSTTQPAAERVSKGDRSAASLRTEDDLESAAGTDVPGPTSPSSGSSPLVASAAVIGIAAMGGGATALRVRARR